MIAAVNTAGPDVLRVGMTAPKQEKWIYRNRDRLNVKFIAAVGAVFDFYTGTVKRSHPGFQKLGLEWLPRLLQQPGRLWSRTVISAPVFLFGFKPDNRRSGFRVDRPIAKLQSFDSLKMFHIICDQSHVVTYGA